VVSCQLPLLTAEEITFENERFSNFEGLVTLTLDRVILHTVVHHSSTSTYVPNFNQIEETFCGRTDGDTVRIRTDVHLSPTLLGRFTTVGRTDEAVKIKTKGEDKVGL